MFSDIGDISSIQADGAPPSVLAAGGAAGESGVRVAKLNYQGSAHFTATLHQISVEPGRLALAAAEDSAFAAELIDRLAGYDVNLLHLGMLLIEECAADSRAARCSGMRQRACS
jgi:hypothetical protein